MTVFKTSRIIPASVQQVFVAFEPSRLCKWWGPEGFTNTFDVCEFKTGGRWLFVMHGPDGKNYPNDSMFAKVQPPSTVVVQHISEPKFTLSITLSAEGSGTVVSWAQDFENAEIAARIEHIVVPANEQNLDRLTAEVLQNA